MSTLIAHSPRFSSAAALIRHYKAVRHRMNNLAPPPVLALPSPEIMARGNTVLPAPAPKPAVTAAAVPATFDERPRVLVTGLCATVIDIVPEQYGKAGRDIDPLSEEIERIVLRRAITAYFARLRHDRVTRRAVLVRDVVISAFKMDARAVLGPTRTWGAVRPRQFGMCLAKRLTDASLPEIGRAFAGKDHTTVLHAVRKMATRVDEILVEMYDGQACTIGDAE